MLINLAFGIKFDLEAIEKRIAVPIVRLLGLVEFRCKNRWSAPYNVIIDTGSPISVFPSYIQKEADIRVLFETKISGLVPDEKATLRASLSRLTFRIGDKERVTAPIESHAYITDTDKIPLILGFSDILNCELKINYRNKKASLLF
ncbi:MAG: hypothetical protein ABH875_04430 [Candidatus Omnitrophota bacterium]